MPTARGGDAPFGRRGPPRPDDFAGPALAGLVLLASGLAVPSPLAAQSGSEEATGERVTGQIHRTIRRSGPGPLPRPAHGVRLGASTAGVAGSGFRAGSPGAPGSAAFGPPAGRRPGFPLRGIGGRGILLGVPHHLVHGPIVHRHRHRRGAAGAVAPAAGAARAAGVPYRPPVRDPRPLPSAAAAPRGACAAATVRMIAGADRRLRIAIGPLGVETLAEAEAVLAARVRRGEPVALRGWDGSGLIASGELVRRVTLTPCAEGGDA